MKQLITLLSLSTLLVSLASDAAVDKLSHHSRANCAGFNESISWDLTGPHKMQVESGHYPYVLALPGTYFHLLRSAVEINRRVGEFHGTEAYIPNQWIVIGTHEVYPPGTDNDKPTDFIKTSATDCRASEGWWEGEDRVAQDKVAQDMLKAAQAKMDEIQNARRKKEGLPEYRVGVTLVPRDKLYGASSKEMAIKRQQSIAHYGYDKQDLTGENTLFNIKALAQEEFKKNRSNANTMAKHLRRTIEEIKMAYPFIGVPEDEIVQSIGFIPSVTYIKGRGWAAAAQYFIHHDLGNCEFEERNMPLFQGSVMLAKEDVTWDVNRKVTQLNIKGNPEQGFIYNVRWLDDQFSRTLECANKQFSQENRDKLLQLAKRIDTYDDEALSALKQ